MTKSKIHPNIRLVVLVGLAATLLAYLYQTSSSPSELDLKKDTTEILRTHENSFADMLSEAQEPVVAVYTAELVQYLRFDGNSRDQYLRDYFGLPRASRNADVETRRVPQGVGSGVILSQDGFIVTNNHVIANDRGEVADEILVRLNSGKDFKASVVGIDPQTDLAVLKIDAAGLPAAVIADSAKTRVGDKVFAIGNPMGVGLTVTSGIISAKNRSIGIYGQGGYENFIQTDASINPGNSGGALVDAKGRIIGINSAILSRSGGNVGIGFAIPSNLMVEIIDQLTRDGKVNRRIIGIQIAPVDGNLAREIGISSEAIVIKAVEPESMAASAGLLPGDIITHIEGRRVKGSSDLRTVIAHSVKGKPISMKILRNGVEQEMKIQ